MLKKQRIDSFRRITVSESGMRQTIEYEILRKNGKAEISLYDISYCDGEKRRVLRKRALCDEGCVLDALNKCRVFGWNGFYGRHPRGVRDGTAFSFFAEINGGVEIKASGSQKFPKFYRDFTDLLYGVLEEC